MFALLDQTIYCPYCDEPITLLIDPSIPQQAYIEDCQVCCQPIEIQVQLEDGEIVGIHAFQDNE